MSIYNSLDPLGQNNPTPTPPTQAGSVIPPAPQPRVQGQITTPEEVVTIIPDSLAPKSHLLRNVLLIALIVLIGLGVWGYFWLYQHGTKSIPHAFQVVNDASGYHVDLGMKITEEGKENEAADFSFSADVDSRDKENIKSQINIDATIAGMILDADLRVINKTTYIKVNEFPLLAMFLGQDFLETWYSISEEDAKSFGETSGVDPSVFETTNEHALKDPHVYIKGALESGVVELSLTPKIKKVDEVWVREYVMNINEEKIPAYIIGLYKEVLATTTVPQEVEDELKLMIEETEFKPVTITTKVFGGALHSISTELVVEDKDIAGKAVVSVVMTYSDVGGDFLIVEPDDSKKLIDLFSGLMSGSFGFEDQAGSDAESLEYEMSGLRMQAEIHYSNSNSYLGFCKTSAISAAQSKVSSQITCRDSAQGYVVYVANEDTSGDFLCVDSTGVIGQTLVEPRTLACK